MKKLRFIHTAYTSATLFLLTPFVIHAQEFETEYFEDAIGMILALIEGYILPVIIGIGLVFFMWGLVVFILNADNDSAREAGRQKMIWGLIALTIMVSV